jgi:hypothetical protein
LQFGQPGSAAQLIVVSGVTGSCGATTLATNLAFELAEILVIFQMQNEQMRLSAEVFAVCQQVIASSEFLLGVGSMVEELATNIGKDFFAGAPNLSQINAKRKTADNLL